MRVAERAEETATLTGSPESRATAGARPLLQRSVAWSRKLTPFATEIVPLRHANCPRHRTSGYVKNHAVIVLGHLHTKSMTASAAGTLEQPGRKVKHKSRLNRAILWQGWGELGRQLEYKQSRVEYQSEAFACGFSGNVDEVAAQNQLRKVLSSPMTDHPAGCY